MPTVFIDQKINKAFRLDDSGRTRQQKKEITRSVYRLILPEILQFIEENSDSQLIDNLEKEFESADFTEIIGKITKILTTIPDCDYLLRCRINYLIDRLAYLSAGKKLWKDNL